MIETREQAIHEAALAAARSMAAAAISAPKASGNDTVQSFVLTGEDKQRLAGHMRDIARETDAEFFERDAGNAVNAWSSSASETYPSDWTTAATADLKTAGRWPRPGQTAP